MHPSDPITILPKVGPKVAKTLSSMGMHTIGDLLFHFPTRYLDYSKFTAIKDLQAEETVTIRGTIKTIAARFSFRTKKMLTEAVVSDTTGSMRITWFNQGYVADALDKGDEVLLSGKVDEYKGLQLINPIYEKVGPEHIHTGRLVPVYKLPDTIFPKAYRALVHHALPTAKILVDNIPEHVRSAFLLPAIAEAVQELHFPTAPESLHRAQERLAFEESFIQQLAVEQHKIELKKLAAPSIATHVGYIKELVENLPFDLTTGQKKALWAILQDLEHKHPMNRLLQGDVGSGKTIVALLAALQVLEHGYQAALLVPTEVLAKQHFENIKKQVSKLNVQNVKIALHTKNFHELTDAPLAKKELLQTIQKGNANLVIGTHALLQESVTFKNLAFVIIDEQHRFGVEQRRSLTTILHTNSNHKKDKAVAQWIPHLLSMSATPIPRTAALTLYGDLEISTINELPKNRLPIKTWVVPEHKRAGAYEFIKKEITTGRQAFIITPLVEESNKLQAKSAKAEFERLQKNVFPHLKLGLVYGSLKGTEKDAVMNAFKNRETDILVATSVIEIGIDIPNASVILIEDADRFGLAQLHQLRGRVGRSTQQSYCLLFTEVTASTKRLEFFAKTRNGFTLAEYDMQTRGFGSLFGTNQTGFNFKYGQYLTLKVLEKAKQAASTLTQEDPSLGAYPLLKEKALPLSAELHME